MSDKHLHIAGMLMDGWQKLTFHPFREGVEMCLLHSYTAHSTLSSSDTDAPSDQPSIALLRYAAGASVPRHRHPGVETILVLEGSQSDERGVYETGSMVINPVGSEHSVWSENGCVVLIQWDKPVEFI